MYSDKISPDSRLQCSFEISAPSSKKNQTLHKLHDDLIEYKSRLKSKDQMSSTLNICSSKMKPTH